MTTITGRTRVFAVLGRPVAHSLSPVMHNAVFHALGLDAAYVALACSDSEVAGLMRSLARSGGGGNVTIPHKGAAAAAVDRFLGSTPGACNTFWADGDDLAGDNTDVEGILRAADRLNAPTDAWLVVGTGGSARGVLAAAREREVAIAVRSRSADRAEAFLTLARETGVETTEPGSCRFVINATPLGLSPDDPLPTDGIPPGGFEAALDLVYAPGGTRWVRALSEQGCRAVDGREVLIAQGAAALRRWFPRVVPPEEIMHAAIRRALG